jgi:hypothetical protein
VAKVLGVIRVGKLMHASVGEMLPWRALAGIAVRALVSCVPVLWLQHVVSWPPLVTFLVGAALYGGTYGALNYGSLVLRYVGARVPVHGFTGSWVHGRFTGAPMNDPEPMNPMPSE